MAPELFKLALIGAYFESDASAKPRQLAEKVAMGMDGQARVEGSNPARVLLGDRGIAKFWYCNLGFPKLADELDSQGSETDGVVMAEMEKPLYHRFSLRFRYEDNLICST